MHSHEKVQQLYKRIDKLSHQLQEMEYKELGNKIHFLVHKVAWTTSSELFSELTLVFESLLSNAGISSEIKNEIAEILKVIQENKLC